MLAFWGPLGCPGVLGGVSCWPSGVLWAALGVTWAPLGASRWSFGVPLASFGVRWVSLGGPLVPQGALLSGSWVAFWLPWCRLVRFLVALGVSRGFFWRFRGLARNPAAKKRAVETQAGHTHTHATSFTKPRFPFHDSQVPLGGCFARQVQYFRGVDLNKGTLVPEGSLGAFWGSFCSLLGCLWVLWGLSCWPLGSPGMRWASFRCPLVPQGAP